MTTHMNSRVGHQQKENESRPSQQPALRPEMTVRLVAADYPACREVFREYGEPADRPGRFGHLEPLTHFARRHGICLDELLQRLSQAAGVPEDRTSGRMERIHRGFIFAALAITLTLGAGWGAWLLWRIAISRDFSAVATAHIVAHGEAQLWGFIALFITGISLRTTLKNSVRSRLSQNICTGLLLITLVSLAGGLAWSLAPELWPSAGLTSAVVLFVTSLVLWVVQLRILTSKWRETSARAIMISGMWLTIWAIATCLLRWRTGDAGPGAFSGEGRLLLIELAVFGFAMNSIYGFGQILLPGLLRLKKTRSWAIEGSFWLHNLGVGLIVLSSAALLQHTFAVIGFTMVAVGAVLYATGQHAFVGKRRTSHRPEKGHWLLDLYVPLAFSWLLYSLVMLVAGQVYEMLAHKSLPYAFLGAVRHALTVGFLTTLVLGVGQRLLPVIEHTVLTRPQLIAPILILIAGGNALRVTSQMATMAYPIAYTLMPISAVLEWTALLLFAINMFSQMWHTDPFLRFGRVNKMSSLAVLLAETPWLEDNLIERGSSYLGRARSVPQELTIATFAESEGHSATGMVDYINRCVS